MSTSPDSRAYPYRQIELQPGPAYRPWPVDTRASCVPARFEEIVALYPERLAVKSGTEALTYAQLNQLANKLAHAILRRRGAANEPVGLLLEHNASLIMAVIGTLKAAKIYVPLDPAYPAARMQAMLADAQPDLLITNTRNLEFAQQVIPETAEILNLDELGPDWSMDDPALQMDSRAGLNLTYTSGSTGQPKGVLQTHRNVLYLSRLLTKIQKNSPEDRFSLLIPVTFGASTADIFSALLVGAALVLFDLRREGTHRLAGWLRQEQISVYHSVPTVFRQLLNSLRQPGELPSLRLVKLGGEAVLKRDVELFQKFFPGGCVMEHALGTTETYLSAHWLLDTGSQSPGALVPIGYPTEGTQVYIWDEQRQEVPQGEVGQIAIRSRYLSPGYWRKPEQTAAAFLPDPEGGEARIYLSGDLGRVNAQGMLEYLGRIDEMLKIRGQRIETAEIELALLEQEGVSEAVVVAQEARNGERRLVGYFVPARQPAPKVSNLRQALSARLPAYMLPSALVCLERFPLLPFGKVNRNALPQPVWSREALSSAYAPAVTPTQAALVRLWAQVLRIQPDEKQGLGDPDPGSQLSIGIHDNFFELGGDSLAIAELGLLVEENFQIDLPMADFFDKPTIVDLAALIEARMVASAPASDAQDLDRALRLLGY